MADDDAAQADLQALLVDLGHHLDIATPPDLVDGVLARLSTPSAHPGVLRRPVLRRPVLRRPVPRRPAARRRVVRWTAAAVVAVVALVGLTPAGRAAVSRVARVFGVELRVGTPTAPPRPERLPGETSLPTTGAPTAPPSGAPVVTRTQTRVALDAARKAVSFTVQVPSALGDPDEVLVSDGGRVLSLVYRSGPGRPHPGPGGVSARLDEFDGEPEPAFFKLLPVEAKIVELDADRVAAWIGEPHDATYVDADGRTYTESAHLAANTLIWSVGDVTLRLEGDFTEEEAVAVARSTTPLLR